MNELVVMSPNNGAICVAIPLYTRESVDFGEMGKHRILMQLESDRPVAYAMDIGEETLHFFNAEWVEKNLEVLGDL